MSLNVFIVGHTDSQGPYAYNLDLSRRRAEAIAAELVKTYHIGAPRLQTAGVAHLAPVGSNATEAAGREPEGGVGGAVATPTGKEDASGGPLCSRASRAGLGVTRHCFGWHHQGARGIDQAYQRVTDNQEQKPGAEFVD